MSFITFAGAPLFWLTAGIFGIAGFVFASIHMKRESNRPGSDFSLFLRWLTFCAFAFPAASGIFFFVSLSVCPPTDPVFQQKMAAPFIWVTSMLIVGCALSLWLAPGFRGRLRSWAAWLCKQKLVTLDL